jgi:cyclohexa-1,5-dienecarbonyl-CoA hydratase
MRASQTSSRLSRDTMKRAPGIAWIGLQNPPLNIIDIAMMEELAEALAEIESRPDISVVLLGGDGKGFSGGVDIAAHTPDKVEEMLSKFHAVIRALVTSKKVVVAAVHGHCLGGGAELAMVCDIVFTTEAAQWGFPEIQLGCYPPVACTALAALVGQKRAAELILTGRTIGGKEATEIGLANRTVVVDDLAAVVEECTRHLSSLSPAALAITKKAMYAWDSMHFDKGLARAEKIYLEELMKTADAKEGITAFLDKRKPKWAGK